MGVCIMRVCASLLEPHVIRVVYFRQFQPAICPTHSGVYVKNWVSHCILYLHLLTFDQIKSMEVPYGLCNSLHNTSMSDCRISCRAGAINSACGCVDVYMVNATDGAESKTCLNILGFHQSQ